MSQKEIKEKEKLNSIFVGNKWVDAYNCGSGAELNCIILILERAIKENWDLFQLFDYLKVLADYQSLDCKLLFHDYL